METETYEMSECAVNLSKHCFNFLGLSCATSMRHECHDRPFHVNSEEKCDVTLPWQQNVLITTMGSLSNDDSEDNENDKNSIGFIY